MTEEGQQAHGVSHHRGQSELKPNGELWETVDNSVSTYGGSGSWIIYSPTSKHDWLRVFSG